MLLRLAFILISFSIYVNGQQVIRVSQLKADDLVNEIDVTPPFSVYFSGSRDDDEQLKQIYLKTDGEENKSFYVLKYSKLEDKMQDISQLLAPFEVNSTATITTPLSKSTLTSLNGFIYIVPFDQVNDKCFRVYNVDNIQYVITSKNKEEDCTLVFLNSNHITSPVQSSLFTFWEQRKDATAKLYRGYPKNGEEGTPVFSNPLEIDGKSVVFIPDRFSVRFEIFHIITTRHVYFKIRAGHLDLNGHTTSGDTTTGFFMKKATEAPHYVNMICYQDTRFNATVGVNIIGDMKQNTGTVTVRAVNYLNHEAITVRPKSEKYTWTADLAPELTISSQNAESESFYIQYFIVQDQQISERYRTIQ